MADHKNLKNPHDNDGKTGVTNLLSKIMAGMSEEGRVATLALLALPLAKYMEVDAQLTFWVTLVALGGYLSLRLVSMMPK